MTNSNTAVLAKELVAIAKVRSARLLANSQLRDFFSPVKLELFDPFSSNIKAAANCVLLDKDELQMDLDKSLQETEDAYHAKLLELLKTFDPKARRSDRRIGYEVSLRSKKNKGFITIVELRNLNFNEENLLQDCIVTYYDADNVKYSEALVLKDDGYALERD